MDFGQFPERVFGYGWSLGNCIINAHEGSEHRNGVLYVKSEPLLLMFRLRGELVVNGLQ